jgi:NADH:ubiquinone oxidoreductase subunit D
MRSFLSDEGDSLARFNLRMYEIIESINIINQTIPNFFKQSAKSRFKEVLLDKASTVETTMEQTISHFKFWSEGYAVPQGSVYKAVESPKGEFGVYLVSDSTNRPFRCKIRSPAYNHLQLLPHLMQGLKLADLVTLIGTIDIVFGEIDR